MFYLAEFIIRNFEWLLEKHWLRFADFLLLYDVILFWFVYVVVCFLLVYFMSLLSLSLECLISCWLNGCRGKHVQTWSLKNIDAGGMLVAGGRVRYSYLSIFPDDNADIFAASLLILCCSFSSLILSSIIMISCGKIGYG